MRKTYIDNNGFERYEDNNEIKHSGNHFYTDEVFSFEMSTWRKVGKQRSHDADYEGLILSKQEKYFD